MKEHVKAGVFAIAYALGASVISWLYCMLADLLLDKQPDAIMFLMGLFGTGLIVIGTLAGVVYCKIRPTSKPCFTFWVVLLIAFLAAFGHSILMYRKYAFAWGYLFLMCCLLVVECIFLVVDILITLIRHILKKARAK